MHISYTILLLLGSGFSEAQRRSCIPIPSNLTTPDSANDVPAIQDAFKECGDGGTILFPASHLYQIGSPLDLSICHGCNIQIDGTLNVSAPDYDAWTYQPSIFQLAGASNVTISGNGTINGNEWKQKNPQGPYTMFNISSASNIRISGLSIKSPTASVFLIRNTRDVQVSSLSIATNLDSNKPVTYSSWIIGFEITDSSHIDISSQTSIVGVSDCVLIGEGVNSTSVSSLTCAGGRSGVTVELQQAQTSDIRVSDLSFTDLAIEGTYQATGILARGGTVTATNVVWQNVRVHGSMFATLAFSCAGSACGGPRNPGATFKFQNITIANFEGQSKKGYLLSCPAQEGKPCGFQVRDFNVDVTGCPQC